MLIVLGVVGSVVGLLDAFDRMSKAHDPLLALDEFSSHKNATLHPLHPGQPPAPPALAPSTANSILTNITEGVKKYGPGQGAAVGPGKSVDALLPGAVGQGGAVPKSAATNATVPLVSSVQSPVPGKGQAKGQVSAPASSSGTVPKAGSSSVVPRTELPKATALHSGVADSAALSGAAPLSVSSSNAASQSASPSATAARVLPGSPPKVPNEAPASPLPANPPPGT